jgi:hypothetical protein
MIWGSPSRDYTSIDTPRSAGLAVRQLRLRRLFADRRMAAAILPLPWVASIVIRGAGPASVVRARRGELAPIPPAKPQQ